MTKYDILRTLSPIDKNQFYDDMPEALTDLASFDAGAKTLVGYSEERS